MFTIPVISSSTRCVSESSGAMPLNALNGSCQMYNDEPLSSPGLPSYEEAVTSGSMFGLFNVNGGEDLNHRSQQQQQTHSSCDHYSHPSLYQDLAPKVAISSDDFPPRYQTPRGSRDFENDERLDSSSELQCTRFSRITIASNSSLQSAVSSPGPMQYRKQSQTKMAGNTLGTGAGSGSAGWRKNLAAEKAPSESVKSRLSRVLSPTISRRTEMQKSPRKGGRRDMHLPPSNDEDEEKEATSHPVRMRISFDRNRDCDGGCFDNIREAAKQSQHKHHNSRLTVKRTF